MLEDCLLDSRSSSRSRKPATLILSILVHGSLGLTLDRDSAVSNPFASPGCCL
jgi:hypothetical protein